MLNKINNNRHLFLMDREKSNNKCDKSLLIVNSKDEVDNGVWPDILTYRYHGLHYNRSKVSEDFEHYCTKYAARYVGAETAASCTVWSTTAPSSATKRRNARLRWGIKSPGRRLSHLARRRITFSSSNLQQAGTSLSVIGNSSGARQLMIDARKSALLQKRKSPRKSPWKRSPRKSPQKRVKTPNSSTKKRAVRHLMLGTDEDAKPGTSKVSSTKRALFQSPDHTRSTISSTDQFLQKNKSKRALFNSPNKNSPTKICDKKRKRVDEDCHPSKFPRSLSCDVHHSSALNEAANGGSLQRRNSEVIVRPNSSKGELSDLHRKKLLWAVSEALRTQQISMSHPQFRTYASILCKVVKYLMPDLLNNGPRQPGSTSDRMLRIARQHCYAVTRGKSFEEIIQVAKEASANLKNLKPPTGYVSLEQAKAVQVKNVLQDKVMNIESNSAKKRSPVEMKVDTKIDENNKLRNIRRQIIFDDNEITKSCNPHR
ncbi:minus [Carabus blaptoides fortunei]